MLKRLGLGLSTIGLGIIFLISVFTYRDIAVNLPVINVNQSIMTIVGAVCLVLLLMILYKLSAYLRKYIFIGTLVLGLILQLVLILKINQPMITDAGYVFTQAERLAIGKTQWLHYFYIYPNNVNSTLLWGGIYKVLSVLGINHVTGAHFVQLIILDVSALFVSTSLNKVCSNKLGSWTFIVSILYAPLNLMTLFIYNDIFAIGIFNLLVAVTIQLFNMSTQEKLKLWVFIILDAIIFAIGFAIRTNFAIVGIALTLSVIFATNLNWRHKISVVILTAVASLAVSVAFTSIAGMLNYHEKAQEVTPAMRYVNMSWNPSTSGEIDGVDAWAWSELPKDQRAAELTNQFEQRIKGYTVTGLVKHVLKKVSFMYANGLTHQDFNFMYEKDNKPIWQSFSWFSRVIFQPFYALLLFAASMTLLKTMILKEHDVLRDIKLFLGLSLLGVLMFHGLLWEVRDRYALITMPALILLGTLGIYDIVTWLNSSLINIKSTSLVCITALVFLVAGIISFTGYNGKVYAETIVSEGFTMYASAEEGKTDYHLQANSTYKVPIDLTSDAASFTYNIGWTSSKSLKRIRIALVNQDSGRQYVGTLKQNSNTIRGRFSAGKYLLIVKTGNIQPAKTYLFADAKVDAWNLEPVYLNNKPLKHVIPFYQFNN